MTSWAVSFVREQASFEDITLYQLCYWKVTHIYGLTPEEIEDLLTIQILKLLLTIKLTRGSSRHI
jgi:hypothetical protein